jgi:hypothetical protein
MRDKLFLIALTLIPYFASGQVINGDKQINTLKVKPWIPKQALDYQSEYHFGSSNSESFLVLIITKDSCYAQIKSGKLSNSGKDVIWDFENLENARIAGNKFYSSKTDGEFVKYKNKKGLIIYKPWTSTVKREEYEIGFAGASLKKYFAGRYSYASWRELTLDELADMTLPDLRIMRNEIYARYGYIFEPGGDLDKYFKKQSWYQGQHKDVSDFLTGLEKQNIELIQMAENK